MTNYTFENADKGLFAVYQTLYSGADIEMWFDWNARLNDTKWSDDCYFLCCDGVKIGGIIMAPNLVMFPFLISPFCDRMLFWKLVLMQVKKLSTADEIQLKGMLQQETDVLMSFGAEVWRPRQIMCRPTDLFDYKIDDKFYLETPKESYIPEMAEVLYKSFLGGLAFKMFGEESIEQITQNIRVSFERYSQTNTLNQTVITKEKSTGKIAGACIAGINPKMVNLFAGIDDVFVLPEYCNQGLAEAMIKYSLSAAFSVTPVMKLHVIVGNSAEHLYRKLGFVAGPKFTDMKYKK
jgi:ribosomal protein S18 acetylase RimI-like enzyme